MFCLFRRKKIKVDKLNNLLGKIKLIDVREIHEYKLGHIPTAINIPMNELIENHSKYLKKSEITYLVCQSGRRSGIVCKRLNKLGYELINVTGAINGYKNDLDL